ncbi:hypothetical protein [Mycolicibacter arupensis]|uniref:hypothetical protein n=1 Tax=Mycolicibacter arupensis TaxID=342002 RepID=UPI00122C9E31|nr:hypothetical protein [Mycolicibacter arupensis]
MQFPLSPVLESPASWTSLNRREYRAAGAESADRWLRAQACRQALKLARRGYLPPDWREQGLSRELAGPHGQVWVWMKIAAMPTRPWEPGFTAATCARPEVPLTAWRDDTVHFLREQEAANETSVSHVVGFNVVDASEDEWDGLLDKERGPWGESFRDYWEPSAMSLDAGHPCSLGVRAHMILTSLHRIQLSYQVGLAAVGSRIGWIAQHRRRVSRWRFSADRCRELEWLNRVEQQDDLPREHRLPEDWTNGLLRDT